MVVCPTDVVSYEEEIRTFTFRGIDGITIPKVVREEAYELSIDIIIRSIARETYKNYECMPPESFYGVATIVNQDALELKIPIKFPRQRIYYGRVSEAFELRNTLVNFEYMRAYFLAVGESIQNLADLLGTDPIPPIFCCSLPEPTWRELPIREAYFHPPIGTQYEIEVSWLRPVGFSNSCEDFYDGLSKQTDGDKDDGLPPNGIFPNIAEDPENPYANLPAETPDSVQLGFSNSKSANLADGDPNSEPIYTFRVSYYLLWCPSSVDPANPVNACARYTPSGLQIREYVGREFSTGTGLPNQFCPSCPTLSVIVDGVTVLENDIFEIVSVETL